MYKLIIISLLFNIIGCKSQETKQKLMNNIDNDMEYFDIKKFDENKKNGEYYFKTNDGTEVRQIGPLNDKTYNEIGKNSTSKYGYFKIFHPNLRLKEIGKEFFNMPVGTNKVYDENGKLIKETNRDLPYNFSIQDLINKMQKEYKIDILDIKQTKSVFRYVEKEKVKLPLYEVWCYNQKNDLKLICYIINGTTGETIYVGERFIEGKQGSLLDQYLNSKKN